MGPATECIKKKIIKLFHQHGLNITAETNLVQANFLDVTFNLKSGKYWSYHKPSDQPLYVHHHSNHPPVIETLMPLMLAIHFSLLLCNRNESARAMRRSRHSGELQYNSPPSSHKRKSRKQNIVWFNPPLNEHVKTNISKVFLHLLMKHFPPHHHLHKICNKNSVEVSYSCMFNTAAIISRHNKALLA